MPVQTKKSNDMNMIEEEDMPAFMRQGTMPPKIPFLKHLSDKELEQGDEDSD
jgi:hypothetical protein